MKLLLVVVIIAILGTIGLRNLGGKSCKANKVAASSNIIMLEPLLMSMSLLIVFIQKTLLDYLNVQQLVIIS